MQVCALARELFTTLDALVRRSGGSVAQLFRRWVVAYQQQVRSAAAEAPMSRSAHQATAAQDAVQVELLASQERGGSMPPKVTPVYEDPGGAHELPGEGMGCSAPSVLYLQALQAAILIRSHCDFVCRVGPRVLMNCPMWDDGSGRIGG